MPYPCEMKIHFLVFPGLQFFKFGKMLLRGWQKLLFERQSDRKREWEKRERERERPNHRFILQTATMMGTGQDPHQKLGTNSIWGMAGACLYSGHFPLLSQVYWQGVASEAEHLRHEWCTSRRCRQCRRFNPLCHKASLTPHGFLNTRYPSCPCLLLPTRQTNFAQSSKVSS